MTENLEWSDDHKDIDELFSQNLFDGYMEMFKAIDEENATKGLYEKAKDIREGEAQRCIDEGSGRREIVLGNPIYEGEEMTVPFSECAIHQKCAGRPIVKAYREGRDSVSIYWLDKEGNERAAYGLLSEMLPIAVRQGLEAGE